MKTIEEWLKLAESRLKEVDIKSARLDAELILAGVFGVERTYLHTHPKKKISKKREFHANNWLKKREKRIPLAYIFGWKDFFGRNFKVTPDVLVPRPETENMIELYKKIMQTNDVILDIGAGSGVIAITIKLENPESQVIASDISELAINVANKNAKNLGAKIEFLKSDLTEDIPQNILEKVNIITANLPYVDKTWVDFEAQNELHYEPQIALYANDSGLELIKKLIQQCSEKCPNLKYLLLEADPEQFESIENETRLNGFRKNNEQDYIIVFERI